MRKDAKLVAYAFTLLFVTFMVGYLTLGSVALSIFSLMFGNNVFVLEVTCNPSPTYNMGKILGVGFTFDIKLYKGRIPVESILVGYRVVEHDGNNVGVNWRLHVLAYVLNRVKLFDGTINFDNFNAKTVYVYLRNIPSDAQQVYVELDGAYVLDGVETPFSGYGGAYPLEP